MELELSEIINLAHGLVALDGREKASIEGPPVREPYTFTGLVRMVIAHNLTECQRVVKVYQKARADLIAELSDGKAELAAPSSFSKEEDKAAARAAQAAFMKQDAEMLATKHELKMRLIVPADLKLDTNPIPGTVLAALTPIFQRDTA